MKKLTLLCSVALSLLSLQSSRAETVAASKAASVYEFIAGARDSLYVINESPTVPGHSFDSYIVFDLSTLGYTSASEVGSVTLQLYTNSALAAGFMSGFGAPVVGGEFLVKDAASIYDASTLSWATRPAAGGTFSLSQEFNFVSNGSGGYVESWLSIDVTSLVKTWIDHPEQNFGFLLTQPATPFGAAAFVGMSDADHSPRLEVTAPVPEPATWAFAIFGAVLLIGSRRWVRILGIAQA